MGLDYRLGPVNLLRVSRRPKPFRAMNPNAKVPVLIDRSSEPGEAMRYSANPPPSWSTLQRRRATSSEGGATRQGLRTTFLPRVRPEPGIPASFLVTMQSPHSRGPSTRPIEVDRVLGVLNHGLEHHRTLRVTHPDRGHRHFDGCGVTGRRRVTRQVPFVAKWYADISARPASQGHGKDPGACAVVRDWAHRPSATRRNI